LVIFLQLVVSLGGYRVSDNYKYDAYGVNIMTTGTTNQSYFYAGEQWDTDIKLQLLRARYLQLDRGRFHTQDDFEARTSDPAGLHRYLYAMSQPTSRIDPSGNYSIAEFGATFAVSSVMSGVVAHLSGATLRQSITVGFAGGLFATGAGFVVGAGASLGSSVVALGLTGYQYSALLTILLTGYGAQVATEIVANPDIPAENRLEIALITLVGLGLSYRAISTAAPKAPNFSPVQRIEYGVVSLQRLQVRGWSNKSILDLVNGGWARKSSVSVPRYIRAGAKPTFEDATTYYREDGQWVTLRKADNSVLNSSYPANTEFNITKGVDQY